MSRFVDVYEWISWFAYGKKNFTPTFAFVDFFVLQVLAMLEAIDAKRLVSAQWGDLGCWVGVGKTDGMGETFRYRRKPLDQL